MRPVTGDTSLASSDRESESHIHNGFANDCAYLKTALTALSPITWSITAQSFSPQYSKAHRLKSVSERFSIHFVVAIRQAGRDRIITEGRLVALGEYRSTVTT